MDLRTSLNHELKVSKNIAKLFQNEGFNDVTIVLNNGELKANKVILCATSKFFYKAFHIKSESEALSTSSVKVNATKEAMEMVLKYLYTGKMKFDDLNFREYLDLLSLLRAMGMNEVFIKVQHHVIDKIRNGEEEGGFSLEKVLVSAAYSEDLKLTYITKAILFHFDEDYLEEVSELAEVKYLSETLLEKLLSQEYLLEDYETIDWDILTPHAVIPDEPSFQQGVRFKVFLKWLSGNPACTQTFKNKMLQLFDLKEFTCSDITTFVRERIDAL